MYASTVWIGRQEGHRICEQALHRVPSWHSLHLTSSPLTVVTLLVPSILCLVLHAGKIAENLYFYSCGGRVNQCVSGFERHRGRSLSVHHLMLQSWKFAPRQANSLLRADSIVVLAAETIVCESQLRFSTWAPLSSYFFRRLYLNSYWKINIYTNFKI